jgi:hypothetical protein
MIIETKAALLRLTLKAELQHNMNGSSIVKNNIIKPILSLDQEKDPPSNATPGPFQRYPLLAKAR